MNKRRNIVVDQAGGDNYFGGRLDKICNFPVFGRGRDSLLTVILSELENSHKIWIATVNPEFVMETRKDKEFLAILQGKTTFNVPDGIGLIWAAKTKNILTGLKVGLEILGGQHREKLITGADLMDKFCEIATRENKSVYFYGGWGDRSEQTAKYFLKKYPTLKVVGYKDENFDFKTKADFLFVARAMKKQELWIDQNYDKLRVGLVMGVGRSFDYYSGKLQRAPMWMRKMGLEWLFSLMMEPRRLKRQLELPKFVWMVLTKNY